MVEEEFGTVDEADLEAAFDLAMSQHNPAYSSQVQATLRPQESYRPTAALGLASGVGTLGQRLAVQQPAQRPTSTMAANRVVEPPANRPPSASAQHQAKQLFASHPEQVNQQPANHDNVATASQSSQQAQTHIDTSVNRHHHVNNNQKSTRMPPPKWESTGYPSSQSQPSTMDVASASGASGAKIYRYAQNDEDDVIAVGHGGHDVTLLTKQMDDYKSEIVKASLFE